MIHNQYINHWQKISSSEMLLSSNTSTTIFENLLQIRHVRLFKQPLVTWKHVAVVRTSISYSAIASPVRQKHSSIHLQPIAGET